MNEGKASRRDDIIAEEAAGWLVALADADAQVREAFAAWLRESPAHVREFLSVSAIWGMLPELSSRTLDRRTRSRGGNGAKRRGAAGQEPSTGGASPAANA